ncbi:MAG: hypothetical protein GF364_02050 [Candidatus Lokiarchaeota archaeon]|nr:hypothetical protein [Candidatus Lokiarchaeota archaeon]
MNIISAILLFLFSLLCFLILFILYQSYKKPEITPEKYLRSNIQRENGKKRIICIGDSITHGNVGVNYVRMVRRRLKEKNVEVINAGVNSEHAYNVYKRIKPIIKCKPCWVTILIGTNDANNSFKKLGQLKARIETRLPEKPTKHFFRENLNKIIESLKNNTDAEIAVFSIPTIGEDINSERYKWANEFSKIIREVAQAHNIHYMPFFESMNSLIIHNGQKTCSSNRTQFGLMVGALIQRFILRRSYDEISKSRNFRYHIDRLHLNSTAAKMITEFILNLVNG